MKAHEAALASASRPYLGYLEGLRGLLALYVVVFHLREQLDNTYAEAGPAGALLPGHGYYLFFGNSAVAIFIVISGFVLSIPVVAEHRLANGFFGFMKRRARRLLPAYYASIAFSIPLYLFLLHLKNLKMTRLHLFEQVAAHVLLLQDLSTHTIHSINGPLWSIAVEWQIYIAFALILLPIQKTFGLLAGIVVALSLGLTPTLVGAITHTYPYSLQGAHFWYFGLFAMGSAAAFVVSGRERFEKMFRMVPWKLICLASFAGFVISMRRWYGEQEPTPEPLSDVLLGISASTLFIAIAADRSRGRRSVFASILSAKPVVWLGTFSYSLYLIHWPIVQVVSTMAHAHQLSPVARVCLSAATLCILVPVAYAFAYLFEFPFVSSYRRNNDHRLLETQER